MAVWSLLKAEAAFSLSKEATAGLRDTDSHL